MLHCLYAVALVSFLSAAGAQTTPVQFPCDGTFYQIRQTSDGSSTLYRINRSVSPYTVTPIGSSVSLILNALGYHPTDHLLYTIAKNTNTIYQIDANGNVVSRGNVSELPAADYNNGTFDSQGNYYITRANTNQVYRLTQTNGIWSSTTLNFNASVNSGDIALNPTDGLLYGFLDTALLTYNLSTRQVTSRTVTNYAGGSAGSVFFDATGTFYVYRNAGGFYTINLSTGAATLVSNSASSTASDGASCVFPNYEIDVVKQTTSITAINQTTLEIGFQVIVGNTHTSQLPNVQVNDFIGPGSGTTFATASSVSVITAPQVTSGPCVANNAFSSSNSRLLSGAVALSAGQSCTITFRVRVVYATPPSVPASDPGNTAYASSTTTSPNNGYTLQSGTPVPPIQVLAGEGSTNAGTLPSTPNGDTPSATPVPLPRSPNVTLVKTVRNQTRNGAPANTATALPGETIEYCIRFSNGGSGVAGQLTITDTLQPAQIFVANAYSSGYGFRILDSSGVQTTLYTTAQDSDAAEWNGPASQLTYRQGNLAAGAAGSLCFQAQVR